MSVAGIFVNASWEAIRRGRFLTIGVVSGFIGHAGRRRVRRRGRRKRTGLVDNRTVPDAWGRGVISAFVPLHSFRVACCGWLACVVSSVTGQAGRTGVFCCLLFCSVLFACAAAGWPPCWCCLVCRPAGSGNRPALLSLVLFRCARSSAYRDTSPGRVVSSDVWRIKERNKNGAGRALACACPSVVVSCVLCSFATLLLCRHHTGGTPRAMVRRSRTQRNRSKANATGQVQRNKAGAAEAERTERSKNVAQAIPPPTPEACPSRSRCRAANIPDMFHSSYSIRSP